MKCEYCQNIIPLDGFGGYLHYTSTKKVMDHLVNMGIFECSHKDNFEFIFHCKKCGTFWALAAPDFPIEGYLEQRQMPT